MQRLQTIKVRRHKNIAIVAMANKMVRIAFALLKNGECYRVEPALTHGMHLGPIEA